MSYKFNPFSYDPSMCADCGGVSGMGHLHLMVTGERYRVPALYLCDQCDRKGHLDRVTHAAVYVWLTQIFLPRMTKAMNDGTAAGAVKAVTTGLPVQVGTLADRIAHDVMMAIELTEALGRELCGLDPEPEADASGYQGDYEADAAEIAATLDFRREDDGTVTYKCPNPDCPDGNRHPMSFAHSLWDSMPIVLVNALQVHLPA